MLVISVNEGHSFKIGNDVTVHILKSHGRQVKVGIAAPKDVAVERDDMKKPKEARGR
jgi:carbon storage regulator